MRGSCMTRAASAPAGIPAPRATYWDRLAPLEIQSSPFDVTAAKARRWSRRATGTQRWVEPRLLAEVEFAEWTADGVVRQAAFKGLRLDKPATAVVREGGKTGAPVSSPAFKITHPERVVARQRGSAANYSSRNTPSEPPCRA
ncbi:ATP dependent DNA ligase [Paraburkholderia bannensis]|uniref:ATP dependent DNA ligase n=1 Tax=Paraburkholderia bannensis TaxID=765414 RepID=UPI002ADD66E3|nr:hypothetical protein [Paraburkholderia bannensis]